jgi:two-component system, cell cycle sensor histidine kinase and response regulator CckA
MAAGVAHELNNLLTIIAGRCALALGRVALDQPVRQDLEAVQETAERAVALVEQLVAFSRRLRLHPRELDLNTLLLGLADTLRRALGARAQLEIRPGAQAGTVCVDPDQFAQALVHILSAVREVMPDGDRITISTAPAGSELQDSGGGTSGPAWAVIRVTETGLVLDTRTRAGLLEPFPTIPGRLKGPGLRLAAARGIVEQSDGHIEVGGGAGQGTTFSLYLPAGRGAVAAGPGTGWSVSGSPPVDTVIVVDDEPHVRDFAAEVLREAGYHVLEAVSAAQALDLVRNGKGTISLVVTDLVMPDMRGQELARLLADAYRGVKVLFISGFPWDPATADTRPGLQVDFLAKPFTVDGLVGKVRRLLASPRAGAGLGDR